MRANGKVRGLVHFSATSAALGRDRSRKHGPDPLPARRARSSSSATPRPRPGRRARPILARLPGRRSACNLSRTRAEERHRLGLLVLGRADAGGRQPAAPAAVPAEGRRGLACAGDVRCGHPGCTRRLGQTSALLARLPRHNRHATKSACGPASADCWMRPSASRRATSGCASAGSRSACWATGSTIPARPRVLLEAKEEPCDRRLCRCGTASTAATGRSTWWAGCASRSGVLRAKFWLENAPPPQPWRSWSTWKTWPPARGAPRPRRSTPATATWSASRRPSASASTGTGWPRRSSAFDFENGLSLVQAVDVPPESLRRPPGPAALLAARAARADVHVHSRPRTSGTAVKTWRETNGLKAAGGVRRLAGRFVFDLWGGRYAESREAAAAGVPLRTDRLGRRLAQLAALGLRLPPARHLSAQSAVRHARGVPGAGRAPASRPACCSPRTTTTSTSTPTPTASPTRSRSPSTPTARRCGRGSTRARKAQSYRYRADAIEPFLQRNLRLIRDGLAPTAYFIDVWSSIGPYDYWTADGRFVDRVSTRDAWGEHFAWIRDAAGRRRPADFRERPRPA